MLREPWAWWETVVYPDERGYLHEEGYDNSDTPWVTFGADRDLVVLTNPPSTYMLAVEGYASVGMGALMRTVPSVRKMTVRVVWHELPGPDWSVPHYMYPYEYATCVPGEYIAESQVQFDGDPRRQRRRLEWFPSHPMWALDWPIVPTIRRDTAALPPQPYQRGGMIVSVEGTAYPPGADQWYAWNPRADVPGFARAHPSRNPEQDVVDEIDRLVNGQMRQERSGYDRNINQERCAVCGGQWHGLTGTGPAHTVVTGHRGAEGYETVGNGGVKGCPGAFADQDEIRAWRLSQTR